MEVDSEKKEMISEVVEKIADFTDTAIISSVTLDKNGNLISSELKLDLDSKNEILASLLDSSKESEDAVDFKIEGTFKIVCAETPAIAE